MQEQTVQPRKTCLERLVKCPNKDSIAKAIVIENNQIYAYGYDRVHKA